jgi:mono/diheme cytochrome c family protein
MMVTAVAVVTLFGLSVAGAQEGSFEYVGSKSCKKCHLKQFKSWEATTMGQAFEKLKPGVAAEAKTGADLDPEMDYTTDANCVKCHVTGYDKPGGFVDIESTPELANVGCEMCHGPGGTYIQDGYMTLANKEYKKAEIVAVGMVDQVGEAQCSGCHNSESPFVGDDYVFDFAAMKDEGTHEHYPLKYEH